MPDETRKKESLDEEVEHILEEGRMVLPGIQALFGFQLIAVFNQQFEKMPAAGRRLHLAAIVLVGISIALIMAPAAYHRQAERGSISRYFANYASRLITGAMLPLLVAISFEVGLVSYAILSNAVYSGLCATLLAGVFAWLWFIFPAIRRKPS